MVVDELVLLQEVHIQLLLPLGHALLAFCGRKIGWGLINNIVQQSNH